MEPESGLLSTNRFLFYNFAKNIHAFTLMNVPKKIKTLTKTVI